MPAASELEFLAWLRRVARETGSFVVEDTQTLPQSDLGGGRVRADALVTLRGPHTTGTIRLAVDGRSRLTPGEATAVAQQWRNATWDGGLLICCPYISPRVAEICRNAGINYLDTAGNCRIVAAGLHLEIGGHPNPAPDTRPLMNPFAQKGSRIVRVLLENPDRSWQVQGIAKEAKVSNGLVSKSKQILVDEGYVMDFGGLIRLRDPDGLLRAWCNAYKPRRACVDLYHMENGGSKEEDLIDYCTSRHINYAMAGFSSAWLLAPMVRVRKTTLLVQGSLEGDGWKELAGTIHAKRVDSGSNLTLWFTEDPWLFYKTRTVEDRKVTSPIQTYLDLSRMVGRGEEAAQAVFEQCIGPAFTKVQKG